MHDAFYFDDLVVGLKFGSTTKLVDEGEITAFAKNL
jgi:hypothetical protein